MNKGQCKCGEIPEVIKLAPVDPLDIAQNYIVACRRCGNKTTPYPSEQEALMAWAAMNSGPEIDTKPSRLIYIEYDVNDRASILAYPGINGVINGVWKQRDGRIFYELEWADLTGNINTRWFAAEELCHD
jgi:hypothetical protein